MRKRFYWRIMLKRYELKFLFYLLLEYGVPKLIFYLYEFFQSYTIIVNFFFYIFFSNKFSNIQFYILCHILFWIF